MKKRVLTFSYILLAILMFNRSHAQRLAGLVADAGNLGGGNAFRVNSDGTGFVSIKDFESYPQQPKITLGKDGVIYGVMGAGGSKGLGTIFKVNSDGTGYTTLFTFDLNAGGSPGSRLIYGSDGLLYGTTNYTNRGPNLYSIKTDGSAFTIRTTLSISDQGGDLFEAQDGKLYFLTYNGGTSHNGSIVSLNKDGSGYTVVHSFDQTDGYVADGALVQDSNGNLYGTGPGGANNLGTVFTIKPDGSGHTVLHDFDGPNGSHPRCSLLFGLDGNLYSGTSTGGANDEGVIFSINPNGTGFTKIYDLTTSDGPFFDQTLIQDASGFLYCGTIYGGQKFAGSIFKIKTDGSQHQTLYDFDNNSGQGAGGSQVIAGTNVLLGVNASGAAYGVGNVFTINYDGSGYQNIVDFGGPNGSNPFGNLIVGIDSLVYGTTYLGGNHNLGTIFSMDGNGNNFKQLHDFSGPDGGQPYQGLTQGADGTLYGTTWQGGSNATGALFKINANGAGFSKLLDFDDFANKGIAPYAAPLIGLDGKLYGTCYAGGTHGQGTIYSVKTDGTGFMKLYDLDLSSGQSPYSSLIQDANGRLYGVTYAGGANYGGVIFAINTDGTGFTKLYEFDAVNGGSQPFGSLLLAKDGGLYGMTTSTIFAINKDGTNFRTLHSFSGSGSGAPNGSLIQLDDGSLYGMTIGAGGSIFSIHTDGSGFVKLSDLHSSAVGYSRLNGLVALKLKNQSINFSSIKDVTVGDPAVTLTATSSSALSITYASTSQHIQITQNSVTLKEPGKVTINAAQAGDGVYNKAADVQQSFCILPAKPSISIGATSLTLQSSASSGNQWLKNGTLIPNATGQSLQAEAGTFSYTVQTSAEGCLSKLSDPLVIAGVEKASSVDELILFPNPVNSTLNVSLSKFDKNESTNILVYDILGRQVSQTTISDAETASLNVSQYERGSYILKVVQREQVGYAHFIKN